MARSFLLVGFVFAMSLLTGCASQPKDISPRAAAAPDALPGITRYYQQATAHSVHAFRKPVRDQREYALRLLARKAGALLAETETWDSDARLVSLAEPERPAARDAVISLRASLGDLQTAAKTADIAAVRRDYARALRSYRQVNAALGLGEDSP